MTNRLFLLFILSIIVFGSCQTKTTSERNIDKGQLTESEIDQVPDYNFTVDVPQDWTMRDTIMLDGLRVRILLPPESLETDYPMVNIIVGDMEKENIDVFTTTSMNTLKSDMPGIVILERGQIESTNYEGQWFTYTKAPNGRVRDMINYIIPIKGYAYMITCGSNKGSFKKYSATFDKIAKSLKTSNN